MKTDAADSLGSTDIEADDSNAYRSYKEYPQRSVTTDAIYVVTPVDFVPFRSVSADSLFEDSDDVLDKSWNRAKAVSSSISAKPVEKERMGEMADMARALTKSGR